MLYHGRRSCVAAACSRLIGFRGLWVWGLRCGVWVFKHLQLPIIRPGNRGLGNSGRGLQIFRRQGLRSDSDACHPSTQAELLNGEALSTVAFDPEC